MSKTSEQGATIMTARVRPVPNEMREYLGCCYMLSKASADRRPDTAKVEYWRNRVQNALRALRAIMPAELPCEGPDHAR